MSLKIKLKSLYSRMLNEQTETTSMTPDQVEHVILNGYSIFLSSDPKRLDTDTDQEFKLASNLRFSSLQQALRTSPYQFVTGDGNYQYEDGTPSSEPMVMFWTMDEVEFESLKRFGMYLMKKYNQESIGVCEKNNFKLVYSNGTTDIVGEFNTNVGDSPYSTTINGFTFKFGY